MIRRVIDWLMKHMHLLLSGIKWIDYLLLYFSKWSN